MKREEENPTERPEIGGAGREGGSVGRVRAGCVTRCVTWVRYVGASTRQRRVPLSEGATFDNRAPSRQRRVKIFRRSCVTWATRRLQLSNVVLDLPIMQESFSGSRVVRQLAA